MKTVQLKTSTGRLIFKYTKPNNSIKDTLEEAAKQDVNLADLCLMNVDLSGIKLDGVSIKYSTFFRVKLDDAHLDNTDFSYSNFYGGSFCNAQLTKVDLFGSSFHHVSFWDIVIRNSELDNINFYNTSFMGAHLKNTSLTTSILCDCNLNMSCFDDVTFTKTVFCRTDLDCDSLVNPIDLDIPMNLPEEEFIGWKKLYNIFNVSIIVKLKILADSRRSRAIGDKCRCDKALVLEFQDVNGTVLNIPYIVNESFFPKCTYTVGEIVEADEWDDNRFNECSHGIHFFLDRQSAVDY